MASPTPGQHLSARNRTRLQRQETIATYVLAKGVATPNELIELTGASLMTVHRDLDELARRGLLRKFHGGVSAQPSSTFESSSAYRMTVRSEDKEALAGAAMERIETGMSLMLDTSSTNVFLARRIADDDSLQLTVITNYLRILQVLRDCQHVRVILIGGNFNATHDAFFGMEAVAMAKSLRVNMSVLSTSAMTASETYHQDQDIVMIKRAMVEAADTKILLMDPTKIGRTALHRLVPSESFDELLLTEPADAGFVSAVSEQVRTTMVPVG